MKLHHEKEKEIDCLGRVRWIDMEELRMYLLMVECCGLTLGWRVGMHVLKDWRMGLTVEDGWTQTQRTPLKGTCWKNETDGHTLTTVPS